MAKVTEKNTKKEILEALREVEAKLAERRAAVTTTADTVKAAEVVNCLSLHPILHGLIQVCCY